MFRFCSKRVASWIILPFKRYQVYNFLFKINENIGDNNLTLITMEDKSNVADRGA